MKNVYNHNFHGRYCTCDRPYPDSEDEVKYSTRFVALWCLCECVLVAFQEEDVMIQCIACEDWFHSRVSEQG